MEADRSSNLPPMRLRSSQFVFLLLLLCSANGKAPQGSEPAPARGVLKLRPLAVHPLRISHPLALSASGRAAYTVAWPMARAAFEAARMSHVTGLRRA